MPDMCGEIMFPEPWQGLNGDAPALKTPGPLTGLRLHSGTMRTHQTGIRMPEFIFIPAGSFTIGISDAQIVRLAAASDNARARQRQGQFEREQPAYTVVVPEILLARHPVTVGKYRRFIKVARYATEGFWTTAG